MSARLIVNADDFGLTRGINRAVGELYAAGVLTSATLMANGPAFDDALRVAGEHRGLGVGCHVVLMDGVPLAPPDRIPGLLGRDGRTLRSSLPDFAQALLRGEITPEEIELEAECQIQGLQQAGVRITHLDTHKHTHVFPVVRDRLLVLAERYGIGAIRNPFEPDWSLRLGHGSGLRRLAVRASRGLRPGFAAAMQRHSRIATPDGTVGISATGTLDAGTLRELLAALPSGGTWELCCHPGYHDADLDAVRTRLRAQREVQREALLLASAEGVELIGYDGLGEAGGGQRGTRTPDILGVSEAL